MAIGKILKLGVVAVVAIVALVVIGFLTGVLGVPSVTVEDPGDWGNVSENETEVETTLSVSNPNPIGVTLSSGIDANYFVQLNGIEVVTGEREEIAIPKGDSTIRLVSTIDNQKLVPWWREYVRANETIDITASGAAEIDALLSTTIEFPEYEQTVLEGQRPVISAFDAGVSSMEGNYTRDVALGTVGYQIRDASARWGPVSNRTSLVYVDYRIHNPGDVPVPLVPDGFQMAADANDISLFQAGRESMSVQNVDGDALLPPGETRTVTYTVNMSNEQVDDWFVSHVERSEQTTLTIRPQLTFDIARTGNEITIPQDGAGYTCELQTAMLVDDQNTSTTCGSGGGLGA